MKSRWRSPDTMPPKLRVSRPTSSRLRGGGTVTPRSPAATVSATVVSARNGRSIRADNTAKRASPTRKTPTDSPVTRIVFIRTAAATGSANLFSMRMATTLPSTFSGVLIWRNCA